jgi:HSP20 family protein
MSLVNFHPEQTLDPFFNFDSYRFLNIKRNLGQIDEEVSLPKVNVTEDENFFHLEAETPGMKDKDISIEVHNDVLTIKGHKENKSDTEKECYHIREFSSQSFERSFKLSDQVDTEKISAKIDNGVLKVDLSKHVQIKPKKIEVQSN